MTKLPVICLHEDRKDYLVGVKLAVLSLARHSPRFSVFVSCPNADAEFREWLDRQPNATYVHFNKIAGTGWNIKPSILLKMLDDFTDVIWIDSDIIIDADIESFFTDLPPNTIVATQETYWGQQQGGSFRTIAWGLTSGRVFDSTVNSGVVRVTRSHTSLLRDWQTMLGHPNYLQVQSKPWYERPLHMIGDQEVLTGLLGASEYSDIPLSLLRRGRDIAQCFGPAGFTPSERFRALCGQRPSFVHAMGPKPWLRSPTAPAIVRSQGILLALRDWYQYISLDLSPYSIVAKNYLDADIDIGWTNPRSFIGKIFMAVGGTNAAGPGLALSVFDHLARLAKRVFGVSRYSRSSEYTIPTRPF